MELDPGLAVYMIVRAAVVVMAVFLTMGVAYGLIMRYQARCAFAHKGGKSWDGEWRWGDWDRACVDAADHRRRFPKHKPYVVATEYGPESVVPCPQPAP